ncbi:hypothetical protein MCHIJ_48960 [Mycolicibacterium chitae]|uniref:Mce-associated membrane protein n=1 Tax=Mycolicibacterium chitae TaxID=1792 RepID=A0A448I9G4_MYCCI|nr:hypothetical protein [Mycolicibacterium chitae]MCV7104474.1 hypothetical protein [Mycolicibacterium chitae]BBZ05459.1 hypothetical protein MCHIJ_48960 [Mycolicibacterium chitae]VEG49075.1 Uncharacterised protein [Mycolicibacterium chitae]
MAVIDTDVRTEEAESTVDDESGIDETATPVGEDRQPDTAADKKSRQISMSLRGLVIAVAMGVLIIAVAALGWLYLDAKAQLDASAVEASNVERAETAAIEYAVNAAEMNYQDFGGWKANLVGGTSPELKDKLTKAADSMEQVLAPLQWQSTAQPLTAKVRSISGGIYIVDAFVSVLTKTMQAPEGLQSTATYSITLDSRNNWQITDVGGVDAALGR